MKLETFSSECTWTMCDAQVYVTMSVRLKKQMLDIFSLETLLMGDGDDMVKKSVYFGRTLGKWSWCTARTKTRAVTVVRVGNGNPEASSELATKHRAAFARFVYLAQDRLDLQDDFATPSDG